MERFIILVIAALSFFGCDKSEVDDVNQNLPPTNKGNLSSKTSVVNDELYGKKIVVAGNALDLYIVSFERMLDGVLLEFGPAEGPVPAILSDNEGNEWDIFGYAVSGPRLGQRLSPTQSLMGYWFSFATFYPGVEIYREGGKGPFEGEAISGTNDWLVPSNEVRSGGVGRDGIPAVSSPRFDAVSKASFLDEDELVVGIHNGYEAKAYPHAVLDWHEIVNDKLDDREYAIIYCPLTGSATAWDRKINGSSTTFGVSGLLYNTNIIPYDRETRSNWSQLFDVAVNGELKGTKPVKYMVVETKWETWKSLYPESRIMNYSTGHNRNYGDYPYGNYKNDKALIFPVKYNDTRLDAKERVHAVISNGKAKVYRFTTFY